MNITTRLVLDNCEYNKVYLQVRQWNKEGIQEIDCEGYCIKENDAYIFNGDSLMDLDADICGFKWKMKLDTKEPMLCVNRPTHWIEFDPKTNRAIDMCQISDGYIAARIRMGI